MFPLWHFVFCAFVFFVFCVFLCVAAFVLVRFCALVRVHSCVFGVFNVVLCVCFGRVLLGGSHRRGGRRLGGGVGVYHTGLEIAEIDSCTTSVPWL